MFPKRLLATICSCAIGAVYAPTVAQGQTPGLPALQNAFTSPGLAVAANFGSGSGQSFFGAAAGWGMGSGRLQLSGAAGVQRGGGTTRGSYGARVASSLWSSTGGALGLGAFVGIGGAPSTKLAGVVVNPSVMNIPVGASLGYRRAMGATRGISAYASPMYRFSRSTTDSTVSMNGFRVGLGLDLGISTSFGATVGTEIGSGGGSALGVALTFAPGRR